MTVTNTPLSQKQLLEQLMQMPSMKRTSETNKNGNVKKKEQDKVIVSISAPSLNEKKRTREDAPIIQTAKRIRLDEKTPVQIKYVERKINWTLEDDRKLLNCHEKYGNKWKQISEEFGDKFNPHQCFSRYNFVIHPDLKSGHWTQDEKDLLLSAIDAYGMKWTEIAKKCFKGSRSSIECKNEYESVVNPELIKGPWTKKEDQQLIKLRKEGNTWAYCGNVLHRSQELCRIRFKERLQDRVVKGQWTLEEQNKLNKGLELFGKDSTKISNTIFQNTRTVSQCQKKIREWT